MTRAEIISRIKRDRPGESTDAELNLWLDQLDMRWTDEVLRTHVPDRQPEMKTDLEKMSDTVWWGEDSTVMGYGLKATRKGPIISIQGMATDSCNIWINGPKLEIAHEIRPAWSNPENIVGPETGDWTINYGFTQGSNNVSLGLYNSTEQSSADVILYDDETSSSVYGVDMSTMSISVYLAPRTTIPEGWAMALLMNGEDKHLPVNWLQKIQAAQKEKMLIPEIDEEVYIHWLYSKIDYRLGEMDRYNNDAQMFNYAWDAAAKRWHRHHMPIGRQVIHNIYGHGYPWYPADDPLNQRGW